MMSPDKKQRVWDLLDAGRKLEAIRYAEGAFDVSQEEAERLVNSLEREKYPRPGWRINPGSIVGKAFTLIGSVFLVVVLTLYWQDAKSTRRSLKIPGKVVRLEYSSGGGSVPVIEYTHQGKVRQYIGTVSSSPPAFDVGETVELLVNDNNPDDVIVNSFLERYFLMLLFGIFAIVFGGVGVLVLRFLRP